jgi:hypothetical protein
MYLLKYSIVYSIIYVFIYIFLCSDNINFPLFKQHIWTYGIQLWGTASNSNIEILQKLQNKFFAVDAPWYVTNDTVHHDLNVPYIRNEIRRDMLIGWRSILTYLRKIS